VDRYLSLAVLNILSNRRKKGRNRTKSGLGGLIPWGTGLRSDAQQHRGKDQSHHYGKRHGGDMVTENWR